MYRMYSYRMLVIGYIDKMHYSSNRNTFINFLEKQLFREQGGSVKTKHEKFWKYYTWCLKNDKKSAWSMEDIIGQTPDSHEI